MNKEMTQTLAEVEALMMPKRWRVFGPETLQGYACYENSIVIVPPCAEAQLELGYSSCGGVRVYWKRHVMLVSPGSDPASATSTPYGLFAGRGWRKQLLSAVEEACADYMRMYGPQKERAEPQLLKGKDRVELLLSDLLKALRGNPDYSSLRSRAEKLCPELKRSPSC